MQTDTDPPLRILHVEDNANDRELIAEHLAGYGLRCDFLVATTEAEFRRGLESTELDLIISDFTLPGFDGETALRLTRQRRPELPFIFVSGTIGEQRAIECLKSGATDYVLKDRIERLPSAITRALHEARQATERTQAMLALRESDERFRQMAENIEEVFWLADVSPRRIVYVSPAYERISGRLASELRTAPRAWLEFIHPEDRARMESAAASPPSGDDLECRIVRPDGAVRWINARVFPVRNAAGDIYRLAGIAQDITARRQLEEEARHANKVEAIGQFAAGIAHDFNNVLAVIQMQTQLLLTEPHLSPRQRSGLENTLTAAVRAANLTRQLLTFSRRELTQPRAIDLQEVASDTLKLLRRIIGENIAVETKFTTGLPAVQADPAMIEQVLMNLVINARDAMPKGGRLQIDVALEDVGADRAARHPGAKPGRFLCLSVSDTGCGIPPENLARIFEPFFTTKPPGCGTGLGLANVMRIVTQHKGWVDVQSENARGTTFRVYLPALDDAVGPAEQRPAVLPRGNGERIMLVEDDEAVCVVARTVLEHFGYRVVDASTAELALQRWAEHRGEFDLLMTDLILPGGMSGGEMAQRFVSARPDLAVIYTSGHSSDVVARHLPAGKSYSILPKPFSAEALVSMVRSALERRRTS